MPSTKRFRAERKKQLEKASQGLPKYFFVKRTPNDNNSNKNSPHENNNRTTRAVVMTVLQTITQMIYVLVLNPYRIKVTGHNHRLMLIS